MSKTKQMEVEHKSNMRGKSKKKKEILMEGKCRMSVKGN